MTDHADWRSALQAALLEHGFASVTTYADHYPLWTFAGLANQLGPGISANRLKCRLVEEAEAMDTMESCARGLLARFLHEELPRGWPARWMLGTGDQTSPLFRKAYAFRYLAVTLPERYQPIVDRVRIGMTAADIPAGWKPADATDLVLIEMFGTYWSEPEDHP